MAFKGNFSDEDFVAPDMSFISLHNDPRWSIIIERSHTSETFLLVWVLCGKYGRLENIFGYTLTNCKHLTLRHQ